MGKGFIIDFDTPLDEDVDELMTCPHCDGQGEVMEECPDCTKSNEKGEE
jgi:DnaJ-class molecular chaperone